MKSLFTTCYLAKVRNVGEGKDVINHSLLKRSENVIDLPQIIEVSGKKKPEYLIRGFINTYFYTFSVQN